MLRCYITDRHSLPAGETLLSSIQRNLSASGPPPDWIQIREKDLSARALFHLLEQAMALPNPTGVKFLVNTRADVAIAAGAAGLHLPDHSPDPRCWRRIARPGFLIGVSCHDVEAVRAAAGEGADYVFFGPIFAPRSKTSALPERGLRALQEAARAVKIPVLALGGITEENASACSEAGAAGIAAISLFQSFDRSCQRNC